jgi:hypothetical protein
VSHNSQLEAVSTAFPISGGSYVPNRPLPISLEVTVEEPGSRDEKLNHAVIRLIPAALERKQGILVIQRDYDNYTVRVDPDVPCGVTHESRHHIWPAS